MPNRIQRVAPISFLLVTALAFPAFSADLKSDDVSSAPVETQSMGESMVEPFRPAQGDLMDRQQAREFMVQLINRDREAEKLQPVTLDKVASDAGQAHTDEMVVHAYLGHWGLDGKKPPQRYTEGGGNDYVSENAWYEGFKEGDDGKPDADPKFSKEELAQAEKSFIDEKPPMDGHRKNILNKDHNRVGICLSRATGQNDTFRLALTQEFIDHYGKFVPLPLVISKGEVVHVAGRMDPGMPFYNVTLYKEDLPKPMTVEELNKTYSYQFPPMLLMYWPPPFRTAIPVQVMRSPDGDQFSIDIPFDNELGQEALYSVGIWGTREGTKEHCLVSFRTIELVKASKKKRESKDES